MEYIKSLATLLMNKIYAYFYGDMKTQIIAIHQYSTNKPQDLSEPIKINRATKTKAKAEFKRDILDSLDNYFVYIKRMKKRDPEAYALYKKVGAQLVIDDEDGGVAQTMADWDSLPSRWKTVKPGFGCFLWPDRHDEDAETKENWMPPRFAYFMKLKKPPRGVAMAQRGWDVYQVSYHFEMTDKKTGTVDEHYFAIDSDNNVYPLKVKFTQPFTIKSSRPDANGSRVATCHRQTWGFNPSVGDRIADRARRGFKTMTEEEYAKTLFYTVAQFYELAQSQMVEVRATKSNICARFNIRGDVSAYLFNDRELIGNSKKKIFHSVRPHLRDSNGRHQKIKMHFRGERSFTWNGYAIEITVPLRETVNLPDFDVAAQIYADDEVAPAGSVDMAHLGDKIKKLQYRTLH